MNKQVIVVGDNGKEYPATQLAPVDKEGFIHIRYDSKAIHPFICIEDNLECNIYHTRIKEII